MHPFRKHGRIVDDDVPLAALEGVELTVAIADQLLDSRRQFVRMRFAAIEDRDLVPARERVLHLEWAGESSAAENQNLERFCGFLRGHGGLFLCDHSGSDEPESDAQINDERPADQLHDKEWHK